MQIVARANLLSYLTGPSFDPDSGMLHELTIIANAVLADAPAEYTHFLLSDHENGDDPEVRWPEFYYEPGRDQLVRTELVPYQQAPVINGICNGGFYMSRTVKRDELTVQPLYYAVLGDVPIMAGAGFAITPVTLVE